MWVVSFQVSRSKSSKHREIEGVFVSLYCSLNEKQTPDMNKINSWYSRLSRLINSHSPSLSLTPASFSAEHGFEMNESIPAFKQAS